MNLTPLHDRVIVKPAVAEEMTKGGIIIPDTVKEKPQRGEIVAVGAGKVAEDGSTTPLTVKIGDSVLHFDAKPGGTTYGILQNPYLLDRAELKGFTSTFTIIDEETVSYTSDLLLRLTATGAEMHHTDENTLKRVKRFHPGSAYS